jgi:hypothetical protein
MEYTTRVEGLMLAVLALALGPGIPAAAQAQQYQDLPQTFTAFGINMNAGARVRAGTIEITIERWSTDAERDKLLDTLIEKGADKLLDVLQSLKPRVGFVRSSTSLGWDLHYVRQIVHDDGSRRILLATNRPVSFFELRNNTRSTDYEFTLVELRLNKDGKGEGKYAPAVKVNYDKETRTIQIENYGQEPVRLTEVVQVSPKPKK